MKYDDASWHSGGDFPADLPPEAGATHIGMFVAWALLEGLAGDLHRVEGVRELAALRARDATPGRWFLDHCDGKFTTEDLNETGNAFAARYFGDPEAGLNLEPAGYLADYAAAFPDVGDLYRVPDSWESFDRLAPLLGRRFAAWSAGRS